MTPIYLALVVLAGTAVSALWGRRGRVPAPPLDRTLDVWRRAVQERLPAAFRAVQLPTVATKETYRPVRLTAGRPIGGVGWQWRIETPGGATIGHVRERLRLIESAVNATRPLVAVLDVQADPVHEGWGTLRAYRRDPIHAPRPIAEVCRPGQRLMQSPTGSMLVGVTRWGKHARLPLHASSMLVAGQTRRGKSSAVMTILANVLPLVADGRARVRFIDVSVKQGTGYHWLRRDGWLHSWATTPREAFATLDEMSADLAARVNETVETYVTISRANPLDVLVIEEAPAFLAHKGASSKIEALARQVAALGGVIVIVSQGAKEVPIELRRTLPTRVAFGLADHTESHNAFDSASFEAGSPGPHNIPKTTGADGTVDWRGVSYLDDDGTGVQMVRWWHVTPEWLRAHAAALRPVKVGS